MSNVRRLMYRIDRLQLVRGRIEFLAPHVGGRMDDLPLQVGVVDYVEVDQAERAHPRRGQIKSQRRTEPARADAQHLRRFDLLLPLHADLGHDQMPRVAQDFVFVERHWNFSRRVHKILKLSSVNPCVLCG